MFSTLNAILLPIFVTILCSLIVFLMYRYGKRPLQGNTVFADRMQLFYTFVAANMLGKFLFFSLPDAIGPTASQKSVFISGLVYLGFFIMYIIFKYDRVNHENPNYVTPNDNAQDIRQILDRESMTITEYTSMDHLEDPETAVQKFKQKDERAYLRRRTIIAIITLFIMTLTCILEGFFLIFKEAFAIGGPWTIFVFFIIDKVLETLTISVVLLYAYFHGKKYRYWVASIFWIFICFSSTIPIMTQMSWMYSSEIVNHIATNIFYAFSAGCVFFIALYFIWIDKNRTTKKEVIIQIIVFFIGGIISWICGIFV